MNRGKIESNFVDFARIYVCSGRGGRGSIHFRREKYIPFGGPDGGDGGDGGNIVLRGNRNCWTLLHLRYKRNVIAGHGSAGLGRLSHGKNGKNKIIDLPIGTMVFDGETGEFVVDIQHDNQEFIVIKGGKGGKGNSFFKSSTNQSPRYSQKGESCKEKQLVFQLKLLADVGLVGFPNAGKSTLLSVVSEAKPKIANYPFTTLEPTLGIVKAEGLRTFVMADIPGIIKGASEGRGLGLQFLRHIERNSLLLFVISADTSSISMEYEILLKELDSYNSKLLAKRRVLVISKSDILDKELQIAITKELFINIPYFFISSYSYKGIIELKNFLWKQLEELREQAFNDVENVVCGPMNFGSIGENKSLHGIV